MLEVERLVAGYPGLRAVDEVDLEVGTGRVAVIVGPNGCGKSTVLRAVARLHRPESGRVRVDGQDLWSLPPREAARRIALLPQTPQAPEALTVAALARYGRHPHQGLFRQWSGKDAAAVADALAATGLEALADRRLDRLSGGQRQRAWLAMALAQEAPLMLLDEPTSMLDLGHQVEVLELAKGLAGDGRTLVLVLHDLISAARYADHLVAMKEGRVVAAGPPDTVVTPELVHDLYGVDAQVLRAPDDDAPVVVARRGGHTPSTPNQENAHAGSRP